MYCNVSLFPIFALGFYYSCYSHLITSIFFALSVGYSYLSSYAFTIFLANKSPSQEGNFVFYRYLYPFLHYHLANLSVGSLVSLSLYKGVF